MAIKIGFFGTPRLSAAVLAACVADSDLEVSYVVSQADKPAGRNLVFQPSPVSELAIEKDIVLFRPEKIRGNSDFLDALRQYDVDFLVVVAYGKILPPEILSLPRILPINIHGSLLPKYRGASPIQSALIFGEKETGVSIMRMDEGMDEGGVLAVTKITIDQDETSETLFNKFMRESPKALISTLKEYVKGTIFIHEQDHALATYTKKIDKEDGRIIWDTWTGNMLYNFWQGYTPWPGVWTYLKGKRCSITLCRRIEYTRESEMIRIENRKPGSVFVREDSVFVYCVDGEAIEILEILIEGKPRRSARGVLKDGDCFVSYL